MNSARNLISTGQLGNFALSSEDADLSMSRANKFRAVVQRYFESVEKTPFCFEESFSENVYANRWRVPDMAIVEWLTGNQSDDGFILDRDKMEVCRKLAKTPIQISSAKLRLELNEEDLFEDLFQCLRTAEWANTGEIIIAANIEDPEMVDQIRNFANLYGIGVTSFGLDADILDDMPEPAAIENLMPREFESIRSLFNIRKYASSRVQEEFDWQHVVGVGGEV